MGRNDVAHEWPPDVLDAVQRFQQGDLIKAPPFFYYGHAEALPWKLAQRVASSSASPSLDVEQTEEVMQDEADPFDVDELVGLAEFAVITSQTCDVNEQGPAEQPCIQVAPVYRLAEGSPTNLPQYLVPLDPPDLPTGRWIADLRIEVAVEKTFLVGQSPIGGFPNEEARLAFADRLGRRRDRAALANELVDAIRGTLKRRKRNSTGFRNAIKRAHSVRLNVQQGPRLRPEVVRLYVLSPGQISSDDRERFDQWWDEARDVAAAAGIKLLENAYEDARCMDVDLYERLILVDV